MSDNVESTDPLTPDDARRAALLANIDAAPTPLRNPYALALGWIAGILLAVGVLILLIAASQASDQPDGIINLAAVLTGVGFAAFGLIALLLVLAIQQVRWSPPTQGSSSSD